MKALENFCQEKNLDTIRLFQDGFRHTRFDAIDSSKVVGQHLKPTILRRKRTSDFCVNNIPNRKLLASNLAILRMAFDPGKLG